MRDSPLFVTGKIENKPECLDEMMADLSAYNGLLGPGPYWVENQRSTLTWLRRNDLNRFRTYERSGKALSNFGGGSRWRPFSDVARERKRLERSLIYRLSERFGVAPIRDAYRTRVRDRSRELAAQHAVTSLLARLVAEKDTDGELDGIEITPVGTPSDLIDVDGRIYSPDFLDEFIRYLEMKAWVDFEAVDTLIEIGPGAGMFAEVMAKLRPQRRLYLIDIPPQLYVTQQVLSAVFPGEVADYRMIKQDRAVLSSGDFRINVLAPWQIEDLGPVSLDLVYNKAGLSEMRLTTVEAYLEYVDCWHAKIVHIRASDERKHPDAPAFDDYPRALPSYELFARVPVTRRSDAQPLDGIALGEVGRPVSALYFRLRDGS